MTKLLNIQMYTNRKENNNANCKENIFDYLMLRTNSSTFCVKELEEDKQNAQIKDTNNQLKLKRIQNRVWQG